MKTKLLLLSTTLLLTTMLSLGGTNERSRIDASLKNDIVLRNDIKKSITYKQAFTIELFNGSMMNEKPIWSDVNNGSKNGETITDSSTGVSYRIMGNSTSAFKYNHSDDTAFTYAHSIKTGGESANNRLIEMTIPTGLTAKVKAEIYTPSSRTISVDTSVTKGTTSSYGYLSLNAGIVNDFESELLNAGKYYFNFSGSIYIGKLVLELQGLNQVTFRDEDGIAIDSAVVKTGATATSIKGEDKLGFKFKHWSLTPNGEKFDFATPINNDTDLYAVYEECKTYTVTFNLNYTDSESIKVIVNEDDVVSKPDTPKRAGYKFDSWYFNNKPFNFNTLVTSDMTLFAKWNLDSIPVINGPDSLRFGYSRPTDVGAIMLQYSASDLEDTNVEIKLENDTYTLNAQELGTYEIVLSATDSSGNKVTKTIPVEVYDDLAPVFEGPTTIYKSTSIALTTNDILKEIKATDAIDGEVEVEVISDSYTGYANKVGDYALNLLAKDTNGNRRTFNLNIVVSDKIPSVWYVGEKNINVQSNIQLTSQDVIDLLINANELKTGFSSIDVISNYTFKSTEEGVETLLNDPGIYSVTIKARYYSGEEVTLIRSINVYESDEATQQRDNGFVKFMKNCYNLVITNICNFFLTGWNNFATWVGHSEWQAGYLEAIEIYE